MLDFWEEHQVQSMLYSVRQKVKKLETLATTIANWKLKGKTNDEEVIMDLIANDGMSHSFKDNGD